MPIDVCGDGEDLQAALGARYEIRHTLGRGGMGRVLLVHDKERGHDVALKMLSADAEDGFDLTRFKREFRAGRRADHPACVRTYDLGCCRLGWYFTLEYLAGGALHDARERYADPKRAVALTLQVLAALDYLHAEGIVHRDVKPQNVLLAGVEEHAQAKLADLGIARVSDLFDDPGVGMVVGSPGYIAPEYVEHGTFDVRSDLFAVGVMLFELLAGGGHPYRRTLKPHEPNLQSSIAQPRAITELVTDVDEPLARAIAKLVARRPEDRFRSAAEAFDTLRAWLEASSPDAVPVLPPLRQRAYLAAPPVVGRRHEVDSIVRFLDDLTRDAMPRRPLLVLSGEGGHGKSRLVAELLRQADVRDFSCIVAGCAPERDSLAALRTLTQSLRAHARGKSRATNHDVEETAPVPMGRGASQLHVADVVGSDESLLAVSSARQREAVLSDLCELLFEATEHRPYLLVVEDAQWSDAVLLEVLLTWVRALRVRSRSVGIVVTHRPAPEHTALLDLLARTKEGAISIDVGPLPTRATVELLAALFSREADDSLRSFAQRVFGERASPLWVHQLTRLGLDRGILAPLDRPWTGELSLTDETAVELGRVGDVSAAIGERASRLSVHTLQMLRTASVFGQSFDVSMLAEAAEVHPERVLDYLDEAEVAGFLSPNSSTPTSYSFEHDRIRETIYTQIGTTERVTLHAKVVRALAQSNEPDPAELAYHYAASRAPAQAYASGVLAASAALARYAYRDAARHYEEAFRQAEHARVSPDDDVRSDAATAFARAGSYRAAQELLDHLLARVEPGSPERMSLLTRRAELEYLRARLSRASESLEALLRELGEDVPRGGRPVVGRILKELGRLIVLEVRAPPQASGAARARMVLACRVWTWLTEVYSFSDGRNAAYAMLRASVFAHGIGGGADAAQVFAGLGYFASVNGQYRLARRFAQRAESLLVASDPPHARARVETSLVAVDLLGGDPGSAAAHAAEGVRWADRGADERTIAFAYTALALSLWVNGRVAESMRVSRAMHERGLIHGNELLENWGALHAMNCKFFLGRFEETLADAEALEPFFRESDNAVMRGVVASRGLLCRALLEAPGKKELDAALALSEHWLDRNLVAFAANPVACCLGVVSLYGAHTKLDSGTTARVEGIIRRARPVLQKSRVERAFFIASVACVDYVAGYRSRAVSALREALAHASRFGMVHDQTTCRVLAARIFDPADPLTQRCAREARALTEGFAAQQHTDPPSPTP